MATQFELKRLSAEGVPAALEKAERYRLLNEPQEAESICLDILAVAPGHEDARITLVLALADQVADGALPRFDEALAALGHLAGYDRAYYEGIVCERRAKAHHKTGGHFAGSMAFDWYQRAMACYEQAAASPERTPGNEDAILRWNSCARVLMRHPEIAAHHDEPHRELLE